MEIPIDIRPFRRTAAAVDGVEYDAGAQLGKPVAEMCVGLRRAGRVSPHVVAYQPADLYLIQPENL